MSISQSDYDFMKEVAKYFRNTKSHQVPDGSIRDTAIAFNINRNKVRKILITMGELSSPITDDANNLRRQGKSIKEIARLLGVSVATVSTALPYEDKIDSSLDPSKHAAEVRDYRAYEKEQMKRQSKLKSSTKQDTTLGSNNISTVETKEWQKDIKMSYTEAYHRPHRNTWDDLEKLNEQFMNELSEDDKRAYDQYEKEVERIRKTIIAEEQELKDLSSKDSLSTSEKRRLNKLNKKFGYFAGALNSRNFRILEEISGDKMPLEPSGILRLHLELYSDYPDDKDVEILKKYGLLKYGDNISRDIVVPNDIPLYALHYVIQRAFGWENSHLRQFEIPIEKFNALCGNASLWSNLTGIVFRSPLMEDEDEFWADDYNGGSFKNWLRKKYTGPYLSQCHGEGIFSCQEDMMTLDMDEEYYIMYSNAYNYETDKYDGEEYICDVTPGYDYNGKKRPEPKPWFNKAPYRVEIVKFEAVPAEGLRFVFERNPMALLERLPLYAVLAPGINELSDNCSKKERKHIDDLIIHDGAELFDSVHEYVSKIIEDQIDSPIVQPFAGPITDVLLYNYDFGDNWKIRITASENCPDLVESGRITQTELDRANVKCREVYRPVLIARDGEMLVDDVGGISGFCEFLQDINPDFTGMTLEKKEEAKQRKKEMLTWAKSLGWHREKNGGEFNLL